MEKRKIDLFIGMRAGYFSPLDMGTIRAQLERMDDDQFIMVQSVSYQNPSTIFLISILLGWERFWLEDPIKGILKIITCYGCLIWWFIDIFSAKRRAQEYNFKKFMELAAYA
jgi:TM2 domain-containing membrane protein YozV